MFTLLKGKFQQEANVELYIVYNILYITDRLRNLSLLRTTKKLHKHSNLNYAYKVIQYKMKQTKKTGRGCQIVQFIDLRLIIS